MNERIDQLMVKAGAYFGSEGMIYSNFDPKKFAKLIVAECIQAVDNVGGYNEEFHMNAIKEHFGVEE